MSDTVHPRSRGEHVRARAGRGLRTGSSPLARGTLAQEDWEKDAYRFIPARAGNTIRCSGMRRRAPVHPRSRGEHPTHTEDNEEWTGSSPLARGTHARDRGAAQRDRFIPARAGNTTRSCPASRSTPVHPRSRGEHTLTTAGEPSYTGSSPLARGTLGHAPGEPRRDRFIPARAGNTWGRTGRTPPRPVHPRSRGEHDREHVMDRRSPGSSPLARGTLRAGQAGYESFRFIPARAGNTSECSGASTTDTVHPRSRGEHTQLPFDEQIAFGSSPLARGTLGAVGAYRAGGRFIPARAGNTAQCAQTGRGHPVHPRSRGEHLSAHDDGVLSAGSSPLARGTRVGFLLIPAVLRFIPARAGNTAVRLVRVRAGAVHPRSRGEHDGVARDPTVVLGSSPLARGTLPGGGRQVEHRRFIPARAGNTPPTSPPESSGPVHPRSRGEHVWMEGDAGRDRGSSPLARGTPRVGDPAAEGVRFIPARAGNTLAAPAPARRYPVHPRSRGEHSLRDRAGGSVGGSSPLARGTLLSDR